MEEARTRVSVAQARLGAAQGRLEQYSAGAAGLRAGGQNTFQVHSPIDGTLVMAAVASGESVDEGKLLFTVIDLSRVWLEARVFEPDIPKVEGARSAWFTIEGYDAPFVVDEHNGTLITVGRVVDRLNRTVPVIFEVANAEGRLRIGQFAKASIARGSPGMAWPCPTPRCWRMGANWSPTCRSRANRSSAARSPSGVAGLGWTGIREGLASGEHVVTKGAYEDQAHRRVGGHSQSGHVH